MENVFIEYPKCSTCKRAKKWLNDNKINFTDRDITKETPTVAELNKWIKQSGVEIKKWFNTSGLKYKELQLKDKLESMDFEDKIKLLASDGMLIKRPIFVSKDIILIGFNEEKWKQIK